MSIKTKMSAEIKVRCSDEEKELLKKRAEEVSLSMSDYVRSLVFINKKMILLSEGAEIAKSLFLIQKEFEYFRSNSDGIPKEATETIKDALNDVSTKLNEVSVKLTDIQSKNEEDYANE